MAQDSLPHDASLRAVYDYHHQTKHQLDRYAAGPDHLDWANQPDPFRRYVGTQLIMLDRDQPLNQTHYDEIFQGVSTVALNRASVSQFFYTSLAISAWKQLGQTRWALRVNPSSGNLHPSEAYVICGPISDLTSTPIVAHYTPKVHGLEQRAELPVSLWTDLSMAFPANTFFVGLTSILWREAWKYGQRAYRYCQHDTGHAIAALSIAAAGLGWRTVILDDLGSDDLYRMIGCPSDTGIEREVPELLIAITTQPTPLDHPSIAPQHLSQFDSIHWHGTANRLSLSHRDWGLDIITRATHKPTSLTTSISTPAQRTLTATIRPLPLHRLVQQRRSAVATDGQTSISCTTFFQILERTLCSTHGPLAGLPWQAHIHFAVFVHRVEQLEPGLYLLLRDPTQAQALHSSLQRFPDWQTVEGCPAHVPLYRLALADTQPVSRDIACFQAIAANGCFSLAMLAEFDAPLHRHGAWFYPRLFWEAGALGQILYLEAEAAGVRATGIGCFFDDAMHELLGLHDTRYQDLYHFTVGGPIDDTRLTTLPPYR